MSGVCRILTMTEYAFQTMTGREGDCPFSFFFWRGTGGSCLWTMDIMVADRRYSYFMSLKCNFLEKRRKPKWCGHQGWERNALVFFSFFFEKDHLIDSCFLGEHNNYDMTLNSNSETWVPQEWVCKCGTNYLNNNSHTFSLSPLFISLWFLFLFST